MKHAWAARAAVLILLLTQCVAEAAGGLSAPTGVAAVPVSSSQIRVTWSDTNSKESGYAIERSLSSSIGFLQVGTTGANGTSFTSSGLLSGRRYYFRVRAFIVGNNKTLYSFYSSVVSAVTYTTTTTATPTRTPTPSIGATATPTRTPTKTPTPSVSDKTAPSVPTSLTASVATCSQVNLSWGSSSDTGGSGLAGYKVYRGGAYLKQVVTTATSDLNLAASTTYSYQVSAVDNAGNESAKSNVASATTPSCSPPLSDEWSKRLGGTGADQGRAVASDASGNVYVGGVFSGTVDLGGGSVTSVGSYDMFVAKYSPSGAHLWSKRFGGSSTEMLEGIAVDGSGNVAVIGRFMGSIDFGTGALPSAGAADVFVAKYSSTGGLLWAKRYGGASDDMGNGVAFDGNGNLLATGFYQGTVDFGGGALVSAYGGQDTFVLKLSPSGTHVWSTHFWSNSLDIGAAIAVDGGNNVFVAGYFLSSLDLGGGVMGSAGDQDIFLVKLTSAGAHLWSKRFGNSLTDKPEGVAVDGNGNLIMTGMIQGTVDFGGGPLANVSWIADAFVAKFTGTGSHVWSKRFGGADADTGYAVAARSNGDVVATGTFQATADFGGGALTSAGYQDIFLVELSSASGSHLGSQRFGGSFWDYGLGVDADPNNNTLLASYFRETADFGSTTMSSAGSEDVAVAKRLP